MTRFFVRPDQILGDHVTLEEDDSRHLRVVLKAAPGARITILDGSGREFPGVLGTVGKTRATARLETPLWPETEPRVQITVAQALPKMAEKMEQVLQRGTEIGAAAFWAMESARSQTHLTGERQSKRTIRWRSIIKTAAEQSHRAKLPSLRTDQSFADVIATTGTFDLALLAYERERETTLRLALESIASAPATILVIIGPESGISESEAAQARRAGVVLVTLGPRILRTETAALALVSQILYALE